jgi:hypothetical protein
MEEKKEEKKDSTFYLHGLSFLLGLALGIMAVIFIVITQTTRRRDKIYSSLLGMAIGALITFILVRYFDLLQIN